MNLSFVQGPNPLKIHFLLLLVFQKTKLLLKLVFRATEFQQRLKSDVFQKALFCTLVSGTQLVVVYAVPIAAVQYL